MPDVIVRKPFRAIIRNREGVLIDEEVRAITSTNAKGVFDVLPEHASFISLIKEYVIIHKKDGSKHEIKIDNGVVKNYQDEIHIFIGIVPENTSLNS